jgi:diazepam-binding inhibitor (GABA receptor modulating acyl-CoA-binding protein)
MTHLLGYDISVSSPSLAQTFDLFCAAAKQLKNATDSDLAVLYGNFKQAKNGNNTSTEPWFYEVMAMGKWRAWTACKDKSPEEAMYDYCIKVEQLLVDQYGTEEAVRILQNITA